MKLKHLANFIAYASAGVKGDEGGGVDDLKSEFSSSMHQVVTCDRNKGVEKNIFSSSCLWVGCSNWT